LKGCTEQIFMWNALLRVLPPGSSEMKHFMERN